MLAPAFERRQRSGARRELRFKVLPLLGNRSNLGLDLPDLLLPILKDEQLLQFRLHARMLWADARPVNVPLLAG
jgi:hypothetical protein